MNLQEMRSELAFRLNFKEDEADQDFQESRLNRALNLSYRREVNKAHLNGPQNWFKQSASFTWSASQLTVSLPGNVDQHNLIDIYDTTSDTTGSRVIVGNEVDSAADMFWSSRNTLQWSGSDTGPSSDCTFRVDYLALAETLSDDEDEPQLIPRQHHDLIVVGAEEFLLNKADGAAPQSTREELKSSREEFWKFLSKARPRSNPNIYGGDPDMSSVIPQYPWTVT